MYYTNDYTPLRGDIIFLRGKGPLYWLNVIYQSVIRLKIARHSHIAIVFSPHSVIDSTPQNGIRIRKWDEINRDYKHKKTTIFRCDALLTEEMFFKLSKRMGFYYKQPYSVLSFLKRAQAVFSRNSGFACSQIVSKIFYDCGVTVSDRPIRKTFPVDIFQHLNQSISWRKIHIDDYKLGEKVFSSENDTMKIASEIIHNSDSSFDSSSSISVQFTKMAAEFDIFAQKLTSSINVDYEAFNSVEDAILLLKRIDKFNSPDKLIYKIKEILIPHTPRFICGVGDDVAEAKFYNVKKACDQLGLYTKCIAILHKDIKKLRESISADLTKNIFDENLSHERLAKFFGKLLSLQRAMHEVIRFAAKIGKNRNEMKEIDLDELVFFVNGTQISDISLQRRDEILLMITKVYTFNSEVNILLNSHDDYEKSLEDINVVINRMIPNVRWDNDGVAYVK